MKVCSEYKEKEVKQMLTEVRQSEIKKLIQDEGSVRVSELSPIFKVSGVTIRRDLEKLEQEEVIKGIEVIVV